MAKRSDKMADCELCGQKAQLESSHNFNVCPTCFKVMQYTRNHPDKIAAAARMLGKDTELAQALGMSDGAATTTTSEGAAQLEAAVSAAMQTLHNALPADLHDLDKGQTHSFLDIEELAKRAAREITVAKNAGLAWRMLMDEVEAHGLKVTATEPEAMIRQFADELNTLKRNAAAPQDEARTVELETRLMEAERERDRLRERLRERVKTGNDPTEDALLQWAIRKYQAGEITLQIEVQEMVSTHAS